MSRSTRGACRIGALFVLVSIGGANAASPAYIAGLPLFSQCGLGAGASGDRLADLATREGRSAARSSGELRQSRRMGLSPVAPGLLAFGVQLNVWPNAAALGTSDPQARFCPTGVRL